MREIEKEQEEERFPNGGPYGSHALAAGVVSRGAPAPRHLLYTLDLSAKAGEVAMSTLPSAAIL